MKDWRGNYEDLSVHHLMGHQRTGCWMKPRAGQNQIRSPCPRAPARPHVRLSDTPRTGRAAEDVGPYHRRGPAREVPAPPSARGVRTGPAREVPAPPSARGVRTGPAREVPAPPSARGVRTGLARYVPAPPRSKKNLQFRLDGHGG